MSRRPPLPESLRSAEIKLQRANLHKGIARREAVRFFGRHPTPAFRIQPKGDQDLAIGAVNHCEVVFEGESPNLPDSFAARFGDAIHNYRCVLDHVAWQLVLHGLRWPLPEKERAGVQFPIYSTETGFNDSKTRRLPGVAGPAVSFIEARHRYIRGKATNNGLLAIANLSNDDKHRSLHVFLSFFRTLETDVTFEDCLPVTWENPPVTPEVKTGAVVTCFSYRVTGPDPKMSMKLRPQIEIVIENWAEFSAVLEGVSTEVAEILNAPEIIAAVA